MISGEIYVLVMPPPLTFNLFWESQFSQTYVDSFMLALCVAGPWGLTWETRIPCKNILHLCFLYFKMKYTNDAKTLTLEIQWFTHPCLNEHIFYQFQSCNILILCLTCLSCFTCPNIFMISGCYNFGNFI